MGSPQGWVYRIFTFFLPQDNHSKGLTIFLAACVKVLAQDLLTFLANPLTAEGKAIRKQKPVLWEEREMRKLVGTVFFWSIIWSDWFDFFWGGGWPF